MRFIRISTEYPEYIEMPFLPQNQIVTLKPLPVAILLKYAEKVS